MQYELRQYDNLLLTFSLLREGLGEVNYNIEWIDQNFAHLLPVDLKDCDSKSLAKWFSARVLPKNRENADQILARSGLSHNDSFEIIRHCKGLSLNDSYWIVEAGFNGRYADYNLYNNPFSTTLASIAFSGYGNYLQDEFTSSPEYTTNGMLRKCWRRINGKIYLYKGGTSGAANTGKEPYSEFYAAQIAEKMGIPHVDYNLAKWKDILCSTCELFTDMDTSYVPIFRFLEHSNLKSTVEFLRSLGDEYYDAFCDMVVFDALIYNTDRHFGNFGLLVDNKTNKPKSFAPLFDHGLSLFNYAMDDELSNIEKYSKTRTPAFEGISYEELVCEFISDRQRAQLRKLINFKFKKHSRYNLPADRLKTIEKFLQKRVQELLNIKK